MHLCILCLSENKQRLFVFMALTYPFFITELESVYCAVRTGCFKETDTVTSINGQYAFCPHTVTSLYVLLL